MVGQFQGKVALVTGASSGMGRATALAFGAEGAKVVLAARREDECQKVVQEIKRSGGEAMFVKTDVSVASQVEAMVKRTVDVFGRLDCAFNNAGVIPTQIGAGGLFTHELTEEMWDKLISVNLKSVWLCMKYELKQMLSQGTGGAIVNNSSIAGLRGGASLAGYAASKHAVNGLTKSAALEYAPEGIRINAVCPGYVDTGMVDAVRAVDPETDRKLAALEPIGRIGKPEEIATAVLWLCSNAASFVIGEPLVVDVGIIAGRPRTRPAIRPEF